MPFDGHKNFAVSSVTVAPSPAVSGTALSVVVGDGSKFPTVPFNATVWAAQTRPTFANAEIVRVTAVSSDALTIVRAQEGSSARTIVSGDQIAATVTAKTLTDIETAIAAGDAVSSVFGRTGAVTAQSGDYTASQVGADASGAASAAQAASLQKSANLSDVASASTARSNLGLGTAATQASGAFDAAGAAATEQSRATAAEALAVQKASNLSDLASASTARTNLGLGSAATQPSSAFDAAGAASSEQTRAQAAEAAEQTRALAAEALAERSANKGIANGYAALDGSGKLPAGQLTVDAMEYKGSWNASTNSPTLTNGSGSPGDFYIVSVGGSGGPVAASAGDHVILNPSLVWENIPVGGGGGVASFNTRTGVVSLSKADVTGTGLAAADVAADASGAASAAQAASLQKTSNLSDVASAASARTNLGLGSAATSASSAFEPAGAVATEQARAVAAEALKAQGFVVTSVKTAGYTAASGDFIPCDLSGGLLTVTLPTAPADKSRIAVKIVAQATTPNALTVAAGGSDKFNVSGGSVSLTISAKFASLTLQYNSSTSLWYVQTAEIPAGQAGGAASLDATAHVPVAQLPANVAQVGTPGTNLGATQSVALSSAQETWLVGVVNANLAVTFTNLVAGQRAALLLTKDATGTTFTVSVNGTTAVTLSTASQVVVATVDYDGTNFNITVPTGAALSTVLVNDVAQTQRAGIDLKAGTNVTLSASDNSGSNRTEVTINSSAGSGAPSGAAGGKLSGTYPNPGLNAASTDLSDTALLARLASPALTGSPTAPTQAALDNSTKIGTTAYADAAVAAEATARTTAAALKAPLASPTFTGIVTAPEFSVSGLTGATAASRHVGATTSGAPTTGTFVVGDWIIDQTGKRWTCTTGGTPGTWTQEPGSSGGGALMNYALITATGTWVVPAGVTVARFRAIGGGAGGGGGGSAAATQLQVGGGGGAGANVIDQVLAVVAGHTITLTIGAGGTGGSAGASGGNAGGNGGAGFSTNIVDTTASTTLMQSGLATAGAASIASSTTAVGGGLWGNATTSVSAAGLWAGSGAKSASGTPPAMIAVVGGAGGGTATASLGGGSGGGQLSTTFLTTQLVGSQSGTAAGGTGVTATQPGCGGGGGGGGAAGTGAGGAGGAGAPGQVEIWW